ncbi:alkyl/aryl-sulfatase [Tomitella gaofuii]|uniref:alkyl/aryl-sulfatase n=1 Tax=Tomitella gaofuii TaxID=2760083 RepID=UPI001F3843CE|nr:alkyl sulfatase dimerization domain-containing protein [Tomitella gaofuii]
MSTVSGAADPGAPRPATAATAARQAEVRRRLPFDEDTGPADAEAGFVATLDEPVITAADGRVVWDLRPYAFLEGGGAAGGDRDDAPAPDTVDPSLWRMARLNLRHGLYRVADRIYQVRGFDLANMTVIVGDSGYIVVDPLLSVETAAAALGLVRRELGERPVTAVIVTHCHSDHFGGLRGVVDPAEAGPAGSGRVPVVAPAGFFEHAVSENVHAGTAMSRRAQYMYGALVPPGPRGQVSAGLGMGLSRGTVSLIEPTDVVDATGTRMVLDGVEFVFQFTPDTEAPAEMNFHLPRWRALCLAENAAHTLHNLYTLRGAPVRDAAAWSFHLGEAAELFAAESDVMFLQHHWPVRGSARIAEFLACQQDLYKYLHDQTLRLAAHGLTMEEIAEELTLPAALERFWPGRGYYGTVRHNAKAVYQRYLGWFDGNPAHLDRHPPAAAARRYVEFMGGADAVLERARRSFDEGDYRWVAEVVGHVVFADPDDAVARALQADAFEQLGYQSESTAWRNVYLSGARELRHGRAERRGRGSAARDVLGAMTTDMLLDYVAIRLDGPAAADRRITLLLEVADTGETRLVRLRRGALTRTARVAGAAPTPGDAGIDAHIRLARADLAMLAFGAADAGDAFDDGRIAVMAGSGDAVATLFGLCDVLRPDFPIVTPRPATAPAAAACLAHAIEKEHR